MSRCSVQGYRHLSMKEDDPMAHNTFHVALYVEDLDAAIARYRKLLGQEPAKVRHDYAKFEISDPPVILSLNTGGEPGTVSHLGIRYPGTGDVASEMARVKREEVHLLDDFRSNAPAEYGHGFPWHPHRGMETITYMLAGEVEHGDSLGNRGVVGAGDVQWMTAGSGIIHQEMPRGDAGGRMGGFQLW